MSNIVTTEIVAYNEFRTQLAELRELNDSTIFDYSDPKGNKAARSHIYKLRKTKTAVDKCRKEEKKASLEYGRKVDSEAKEIISEIEEMISVHQAPIDEIENREKNRIARIAKSIEEMKFKPEECDELATSTDIANMIQWLESQEITKEEYQEFTEQAAGVKALAMASLKEKLESRQRYEAEQAELERLRAEAEARARKEREEAIAKAAAERAKKEAEEKAERDKLAAQKREKALKDAQERAEREKKEAQERAIRAEKKAKEDAERAAKEAKERAEQEVREKQRREAAEREKREANKRHCASINRNAVKAILEVDGITEEQAKDLVSRIAKGQIPNISIHY